MDIKISKAKAKAIIRKALTESWQYLWDKEEINYRTQRIVGL